MSFMGKGVTKSTVLCLLHLSHEMMSQAPGSVRKTQAVIIRTIAWWTMSITFQASALATWKYYFWFVSKTTRIICLGVGAGEMTPWWRVLAALPGDLSLFSAPTMSDSQPHIIAVPGDTGVLSAGTCTHVSYTHKGWK